MVESRKGVVEGVLCTGAAILGTVVAYNSGLAESAVMRMASVHMDAWNTLPSGIQNAAKILLETSASCIAGATAGLLCESAYRGLYKLNERAFRSPLTEGFYRYHPSRFLSTLR